MYVSELDRLNRIKELLNEETCKELINLSKLNVDEYKSIDNLKVLIDVLNKIKITQTNDIYMYVQVLLLQTVIYVIKIQHGIQEQFRLMPIMQNIDVILI